MLTQFDSSYAGHIDLENVGYLGTPVNERRYDNAQLATALDTGRVYDRDLPALAQALAGVADALDRRPGWRRQPR